MSSAFELVTWYDTWNQTGLNNLVSKTVPLGYASRYNLAFGELSGSKATGYSVTMTGQYADQVKAQLHAQAPGVVVYAGLGDTGIAETVGDNLQNQGRSTKNIVAWLRANGYGGISIDAEQDGMAFVAEFVTQIGPSFKAAGLGIAVSAPWPGNGPTGLYGAQAVQAFSKNVDAIELQSYSSEGTPADVPVWTKAGINPTLLMGGVATENGSAQTSLADTQAWTEYAVHSGLGGMFSWRLDNDHGTDGEEEDVNPTFTGAKTVYDAARGVAAG
jgi:hypothetical protein